MEALQEALGTKSEHHGYLAFSGLGPWARVGAHDAGTATACLYGGGDDWSHAVLWLSFAFDAAGCKVVWAQPSGGLWRVEPFDPTDSAVFGHGLRRGGSTLGRNGRTLRQCDGPRPVEPWAGSVSVLACGGSCRGRSPWIPSWARGGRGSMDTSSQAGSTVVAGARGDAAA